MTVEQLEQLLEKRRAQEHDSKKAELIAVRAKVKELEAYFSGKKTRKGKKLVVLKVKRSRRKRGGLKKAVLALLEKGPQPIKGIVTATKGNYGTVSQLLMKLTKEKILTKGKERGSAYTLVK